MSDIKNLSKYFFLGLIFHGFILAVSSTTGYPYYYGINFFGFFMFALDAAVVLAVGLLKGGTHGTAFAASSFLVSIIMIPVWYGGWPSRWYYLDEVWSSSAVDTLVLVLYAYIPATYYRRDGTGKSLGIGFLIAFFLNLILQFPYIIYFAAIPIFLSFILGGLSSLLCFRHLRSVLSPSQPMSPMPKHPPPLSPSAGHSMIRCGSCGHNNPSKFNYCGKCGTVLREKEETKIY